MRSKKQTNLYKAIIFFFSWWLVCAANALSVYQEQNKLSRFEQTYENLLVEIEDVEDEIFGYENKLIDARQDIKDAQKSLLEATHNLKEAERDLKADDNSKNQRGLSIAQHALNMAERGVRTRNKRLERLESYLGELRQELDNSQGELDKVKQRISVQERKLALAIANAKRKLEHRVKQPAVQPAKAMVKAPAAPPRPAKKTVEVVTAAAKTTEEAVSSAQPEPEPEEDVELTELDQRALDYVRKAMARLNSLLEKDSGGKPKRLTLRGSSIEATSFTFLGSNQYRAEAVVGEGKQLFEIGSRKFRRTIPNSDDGEVYVFIYDAKRPSRPRLVMFKKSLLEHL